MTAPRLLVHRSIPPIRRGDMHALGHVDDAVCFRPTERERLSALVREPAAS